MIMTEKDLDKIFSHIDSVLAKLIATAVDEKFIYYTKGVRTSDKWCCQDMREFAMEHWNIPNPQEPITGFHNSYQYKNKPVNYCMFCGIKL